MNSGSLLFLLLFLLLFMLLVNKGALSILAILDHNLIRNVLEDFAALELSAHSLVLLNAMAHLLLMEILLDWFLLFHHEDTGDQSQEGDKN